MTPVLGLVITEFTYRSLSVHNCVVFFARSCPLEVDAKVTCSIHEDVCTTAGVSFYSEYFGKHGKSEPSWQYGKRIHPRFDLVKEECRAFY